jgi:hypothetical protein
MPRCRRRGHRAARPLFGSRSPLQCNTAPNVSGKTKMAPTSSAAAARLNVGHFTAELSREKQGQPKRLSRVRHCPGRCDGDRVGSGLRNPQGAQEGKEVNAGRRQESPYPGSATYLRSGDMLGSLCLAIPKVEAPNETHFAEASWSLASHGLAFRLRDKSQLNRTAVAEHCSAEYSSVAD